MHISIPADSLPEGDIIIPADGNGLPAQITEHNNRTRNTGHVSRNILFFILVIACTVAVSAAGLDSTAAQGAGTGAFGQEPPVAGTAGQGPQIVYIGTYVVDFTNYNPREGTFETNFYVTLTSDRPVNSSDFEMMNGHADTMGLLLDTPNKKYFRIFGTMDSDPDFHRYPFDRHTLPIIVEPRVRNTSELILVIDQNATGLDSLAALPGWQFGKSHAYVMNHTYEGEDIPYTRAVFSHDISRDSLSTFLKFFLPVMLIIIVSLSSLLMKVTSRLGLNASMFLAAVLIHWRIADAIPLVEYATFLDYFMIITYATLVMVLISGILIICYNEAGQSGMIDSINRWSIRIIPSVSILLYIVLFLTLLV